jgi:alpha-1,2-mannosyltransferase
VNFLQPSASSSNLSRPHSTLSSSTIFLFFFLPHLFAVIQSPIPDCDEVFNYWEPSHYLNHGYGMQTWEYSPEYAIRSWTYAAVHAVIIFPITLIAPYIGGKSVEFYFLRLIFALVSSICEMNLFYTISHTLSYRIALLFMLIASTSTGMFHASVAYLPSTFAMYTTMLGTASFMDWTGGPKTAAGITWFALGSLIGWPFAAALIIPFMAMELMLVFSGASLTSFVIRCADGVFRSSLILVRGNFTRWDRNKLMPLVVSIVVRFYVLCQICLCALEYSCLQRLWCRFQRT